jgi:23S rRNA (cytosine1962-C5)-methyltransferase
MSTLRITRRAADRLRAGHLWIYRTDLDATQDAAPEPGSLVTIADSRSIPLGTALYSSASQIAARLVSRRRSSRARSILRTCARASTPHSPCAASLRR